MKNVKTPTLDMSKMLGFKVLEKVQDTHSVSKTCKPLSKTKLGAKIGKP